MEKEGSSGFQPPPQPPPPYSDEPPPQPHLNVYPQPQPIYTQPGPTIVGPGVTGVTMVHTVHSVPSGQVIVGQQGQSVLVINSGLSHLPTVITCRSCNHQILTRVEHAPTRSTHIAAMALCLIGFWPCACLPYCVESCQKADHYCPNCGAFVGSYI